MLAGKDVAATIAVKDTKAAKSFYQDKLGLKLVDDKMPEAHVYKSGSTKVLVYQSQYAGTNKATAATWGSAMTSIKSSRRSRPKAWPSTTMTAWADAKGDVHVGGGTKAAWFKDPDGNILALISG